MTLPTFIPLPEAARRFNLSQKTLHSHISSGTLNAVQLPDGGILVDQNQLKNLETKDQIIQRKFSHLVGQGITISEAAEECKVDRKTIYLWVNRYGYVRIVDDQNYPTLIDAADVACCKYVLEKREAKGIKYGVPLFDENGFPVTKLERPELSEYRRRKKQASA